MDDIILEVNGLSKNFPIRKGIFSRTVGYVRAVSDVSFSMRRGEIFGLVGESGCGKSTTGRTILNLLTPSAGSVVFNGHELFNVERKRRIDPTEMRGLRKEMQIIFQDPYASLDPRMNVGAIISEGMVKHGMYRRMSFPAGSGSASALPARWRLNLRSSSATSRSPRSMFPCRRRC